MLIVIALILYLKYGIYVPRKVSVAYYSLFSLQSRITHILIMKSILLIAVLAVLSLSYDAAVVQDRAARHNLVLGSASSGDRLLSRSYYSKVGIPNAVQSQDISYRGNLTTRIAAIRALEVGYTQYANAFLVSGGLGRNNATIRLQSARGYGYYYQVEFYGR